MVRLYLLVNGDPHAALRALKHFASGSFWDALVRPFQLAPKARPCIATFTVQPGTQIKEAITYCIMAQTMSPQQQMSPQGGMGSYQGVSPQQNPVMPKSHVGFDSITSQIERKLLKRGFQFNVICVGKWPEKTPWKIATDGLSRANGSREIHFDQYHLRLPPDGFKRPPCARRGR